MRYRSTRGLAPQLDFEGVLRTGLARDGGLYVPAEIPALTKDAIAALAGLSYEDLTFAIVKPFVGGAFDDFALREMIASAYAPFGHIARAPIVQIGPNDFLLELFHGPTLAFKDFAMRLVAQLFSASLEKSGGRMTIVGATSGDTGSAAIEAFANVPHVEVFILFPDGRVSEVQRRQMTTPAAENVHALAIEGDFDTCQALVKALFNDHAFRDTVGLAGVNSINWARVMAQVVYYFAAATALGAPFRKVAFTVPTGNFGNVYAGSIARAMGLPVEKLVIATNQNDILHRCLTTGIYRPEAVRPSLSPSMDIQVSSNFERALFEALGRDEAELRALMDELGKGGFCLPQTALRALRSVYSSGRASEEETLATIARVHGETGLLVCPHTAVGLTVAAQARRPGIPMITLATAHPAKFPDAVEKATGIRPPLPLRLADLFERSERVSRLPADVTTLKNYIRSHLEAFA